jgi:hypothetical protein
VKDVSDRTPAVVIGYLAERWAEIEQWLWELLEP